MATVAGVDGCKGGWVVVFHSNGGSTQWRVERHFEDLLALPEKPTVVAVDIPIGLLEAADHGGRCCDREARNLLGTPRRSSVFSPPVRTALQCKTYIEAVKVNRESSPEQIGISQQCFGLFHKLCEVDDQMNPGLQDKMYEVHPEVCFFEMAGRPMKHGKKKPEGRSEREQLLGLFEPVMRDFKVKPRPGVKMDDLMDACAACWTAIRISEGRAKRIPEIPKKDARGLRMEIWR